MSIPITPEDFVVIGERYLSEDIVTEIDRLLPLATADITLLATRGYGASELSKLTAFRATLVAEVAGRNQQRGSKRGSRNVETQAIRMFFATPHRTAESRLVAPAPITDEVMMCVVEIGASNTNAVV